MLHYTRNELWWSKTWNKWKINRNTGSIWSHWSVDSINLDNNNQIIWFCRTTHTFPLVLHFVFFVLGFSHPFTHFLDTQCSRGSIFTMYTSKYFLFVCLAIPIPFFLAISLTVLNYILLCCWIVPMFPCCCMNIFRVFFLPLLARFMSSHKRQRRSLFATPVPVPRQRGWRRLAWPGRYVSYILSSNKWI